MRYITLFSLAIYHVFLMSCTPDIGGTKSYKDQEATQILQNNNVNAFIQSTTFTHYLSTNNLSTLSAEINIGGWLIHPAIDSSLAFQLVSSNLASRLLDYCKGKEIAPDTIKVTYIGQRKPISIVYHTDLIYPVEGLQENCNTFINGLQTQNTAVINKLFTFNVPPKQKREKLLDDILSVGKMYPLSSNEAKIKYIGFSFPQAPSNMDLYQFSYHLANSNDSAEFFVIDVMIEQQNKDIYNIFLYPLN